MSEDTNNWAGFGSEYIKAIEVKNNTDEYAIVGVDSKVENGRKTLILKIQRGELEKIFGCNQSNLQAVQEVCPNNPEQAIGRIITFNKVQVQNPQTHQMVDGLRIQFKTKEEPSPVDKNDVGIKEDNTM